MVAVIKSGSSLARPFYYNDNKVKPGHAALVLAENFPIKRDVSSEIMLRFLEKQASQNTRSKEKAVHISLNFSPSDKLDNKILTEIARCYMEGIGFGTQPFLVYQHFDAGHPHLHIVTTNIQLDGKRISLHNIGRTKSEPVRKAIEKQFGLIKAEDQKKKLLLPDPLAAKEVTYGKSETKKAIGNILNHVLDNYKFTSLPELNAVLGCYNIAADRGSEGSRVFRHKGLYFRILDSHGNHVGVPIKSSLFAFKATLPSIESRYIGNELGRQKHIHSIRSAIDQAMKKTEVNDISKLKEELDRFGITMVIRQNKEGRIYGITYVDHRSRTVFNGSALGKKYSAKGLTESMETRISPTPKAQHTKADLIMIQSKSITKKAKLTLTRLQTIINLLPVNERFWNLCYHLREVTAMFL
jgi:hypothetical protein